MKQYRISSLILLNIISFSLNAQTSLLTSEKANFFKAPQQKEISTNIIVIDTAVAYNTSGSAVRDIYTYNERGYNTMSVYQKGNVQSWTNNIRTISSHDENGNTIQEVLEVWESENWRQSQRKTSSYDAKGNLKTVLNETYANNVWKSNSRHTLSYNSQNSILEELVEEYKNSNWTETQKAIYTYNTNGYLSELLVQIKESSWVNYIRRRTEYSAENKISLHAGDTWVDEAWLPNFQEIYTYVGNQKKYLYQTWGNEAWENSSHYIYNYNDEGLLIKYESESWNIEEWKKERKETYTYTEFNKEHIMVGENWNSIRWDTVYIYEYNYDENGNRLFYTIKRPGSDEWSTDKVEFTVDEDGNETSTRSLHAQNSTWIPSNVYTLKVFYNQGKQEFAYENASCSSLEVSYQKLTKITAENDRPSKIETDFYPNPASNQLFVKGINWQGTPKTSLFDVTGRLLQFQEVNASSGQISTIIGLKNYPNGIYFLKISSPNKTETMKVVVRQ